MTVKELIEILIRQPPEATWYACEDEICGIVLYDKLGNEFGWVNDGTGDPDEHPEGWEAAI